MSAPAPAPTIYIGIAYNPNTLEISIDGPLGNPALCYGILEMAKAAVTKRSTEAETEQQIQLKIDAAFERLKAEAASYQPTEAASFQS